jgi:hypothetical protein
MGSKMVAMAAAPTERLRLSGVRLVCRYGRMGTERERAAEAKDRAAQARDPSLKRAFEEVANGWLLLAEQVEWIAGRDLPYVTKKIIARYANRHTPGNFRLCHQRGSIVAGKQTTPDSVRRKQMNRS